MREALPLPTAPRSRSRIGARARFGPTLALGLLLAAAAPLAAQVPPDSVQVPDAAAAADTLLSEPDSISPDTVFYNLPEVDPRTPAGFETGVWVWSRSDIMASGANTLGELLAEVPGLLTIWGGDYGTPLAVTAFGRGGGAYRIVRDGFEVYPLDGGVTDLQRIPLVGISRVRLDRSMARMRIEMWSHRYDEGRPFSVVEAGTGDSDTNMFRGVFADPTALGGSVAVGLERADTRGLGGNEGGNRTGSWVRYQLHLGDRAGLGVDLRRTHSQTKVEGYAPALGRSDLFVRGSVRLLEGVVAEAYTGRSSLDAEDAGVDFSTYGGTRSQHGVRLGVERAGGWARGALRLYGSDDLPSREIDATGGFVRSGLGGFSGGLAAGQWGGTSTSSVEGRAWVGPFLGLTAFGSYESGTFGSRDAPVLDELADAPPPFLPQPSPVTPAAALTERTALRAGGSLSLFGAHLSAAFLRFESDVELPFATELDFGAPTAPGATRNGFEGWGSVPVPVWEGLRLEGSYQRWDAAGPLLPRQIYRAYLSYHHVHMDSGNLELWWSLGVRGHDPMSVFVADDGTGAGGLQTVPFYQDWFGRIQVRIVTVRLYFGWDNFTLRRKLETIPGRPLPYGRSFFALRWDMWN